MRRSVVSPLLVSLFLVTMLGALPASQAAYGEYGPDGWPLAADGSSTNPYPGFVLGAPWVELDLVDAPDGALPGIVPTDREEIGGVTVYPYYPILVAELTDLANRHPDKVKLHTIGQSTLGLDLMMLEIADFDRIDSGEGMPLEQREVVWIDGGTHSNEYSGVYFVTSLASFLLDEHDSNETAQWIVENRHTWIMPMVNPDGSNLFGRLNANAVNINRNYPVDWGETEESFPMNNPGPHPESEVETRLNIEWFNKTQPDYYASIHCCGNLWLYPYGVEGWDPLDNDMLLKVCDEGLPDVGAACGPIWSTIYPASGSSVDTAYEYTGAVAFGYEMSGRGAVSFWGQPFTTQSVRIQEKESWHGVMHAFENVHLYGAHVTMKGMEIRGPDAPITLILVNDGYGNLTKGSLEIELADGTTQVTELPAIASGEEIRLPLSDALPPGEHTMMLSYAKRIQAEPMAIKTHALTVIDEPGRYTVLLDGNELGVVSGAQLDESVPGPAAIILVIAALALVGIRRRE